jgi:hypothetical protein
MCHIGFTQYFACLTLPAALAGKIISGFFLAYREYRQTALFSGK